MPERPPHLVQATFQLPHRRGGGTARQFHLLRELAEHFEVTVIAPEDPGIPAEAPRELARFARVLSFPVPAPQRNPLRRAARLAQMVASPRPVASTAMDPLKAPILAAVQSLRRPPDVFYVEPSTTADWLDLAPPSAVRVLGFHDLTFAAYRERARRATSVAARAFDEVEWRKLRANELRHARTADLCVTISALERDELRRLAPAAMPLLVVNGVDTEFFAPARGQSPDPSHPLVVVGSLNHPPNVDAVTVLAREVLPVVRASRADMRLLIVGRAPGPAVLALGALPGVEVVGEVDDVRPYLAGASVVCVPIRYGGGIRVKVLDALAMGCAVLSTPKGVEGLELRDGRDVVVAPVAGFARALCGLLDDPERLARLGVAGRALVAREHAWSASGRVLREAIDSALARRRGTAGSGERSLPAVTRGLGRADDA